MPNANKLINHNKSKNTFFNDITNIYISSCSSQYCIGIMCICFSFKRRDWELPP